MREYALVLLVTAAVTYLLTPLVRRIAVATRAIHEPRARDTHTEPTPLLGGLAIVLGLFTRPVAFVLAGEMAVAYFQFHAPQSFFPTVNEGVPAVMYCFFFLYLTFAGPGAWSIDSMLARRAAVPARG